MSVAGEWKDRSCGLPELDVHELPDTEKFLHSHRRLCRENYTGYGKLCNVNFRMCIVVGWRVHPCVLRWVGLMRANLWISFRRGPGELGWCGGARILFVRIGKRDAGMSI